MCREAVGERQEWDPAWVCLEAAGGHQASEWDGLGAADERQGWELVCQEAADERQGWA